MNRKTATCFRMINWSRFQDVTIRLEGSTLITGVNTSGKSTVLDAMTYLLTGNTQFNKAARDRDRTVLGYVRGDTHSTGEHRYLRKGNVITYLAMEFDSPLEKQHLVVGVCIESTGEADHKANWFVFPDCRMEDINFARQEKGRLLVTPRKELTVAGKLAGPKAFLGRETGVRQVMRAMGLRYDPAKYRSKLLKMMAFNPENNIDQFIQDCVLDPGKVGSLKDLREQRDRFDDIWHIYDNLLKCKEQLVKVEERSREYEQKRENYQVRELMLGYQNVQCGEEEGEENNEKILLLRQREKELQDRLAVASDMLNRAEKRVIAAEKNFSESDMGNTIRELQQQREQLQSERKQLKEQCRDLKELSDAIGRMGVKYSHRMSLSEQEIRPLLKLHEISFEATEKTRAMHSFRQAVEALIEEDSRSLFRMETELAEAEETKKELVDRIGKLESNVMVLPREVEHARKILSRQLQKQGADTQVRTLAELVASVKDKSWRKAIETFLGRKRFYLIVDGAWCHRAMEILREQKLYDANVVITDRLPEEPIRPGSAAEQLEVPNRFARRYVNYLLNGIHLCESLEELHDHPKGGLMRDGMLAKGYTASRMRIQKTRLFLGADAVRIQLAEAREELAELEKTTGELAASRRLCAQERADFRSLDLTMSHYHFQAPEGQRSVEQELSSIGHELARIQDNPDYLQIVEELQRAREEKLQADASRAEAQSKLAVCGRDLENCLRRETEIREKLRRAKIAYEQMCGKYPTLVDKMMETYQGMRRKAGHAQVIQPDTVRDLGTELRNRYERTLTDEQLTYCRMAGTDMSRYGPSYIPWYREEYRTVANVRIEEVQAQLGEQKGRLESAFMNDFVAEINERVREARREIEAINRELRTIPFGRDTYRFVLKEKADREVFFRICRGLEKYMDNTEYYMSTDRRDEEMEHDIQEFMTMIMEEEDESEYTDYRKYFTYDMEITSHQGKEAIQAELSRKQGSASNGEKQTPYFIILAASLLQCYPRNTVCARLAFIDEAFSALSRERIEQMVRYFEENGFQVIYAAPPEKISSIGAFIPSTVSLVMTGRYTNAVEGLINE